MAQMKGASSGIKAAAGAGVVGFAVNVCAVATADDPYREAIGVCASTAVGLFLGGMVAATFPIATTAVAVTAFCYFGVAVISNYVGNFAKACYDYIASKFSSSGEKMGAGIQGGVSPGGGYGGSGGPGGVEFRNINPIIGIQSSELFLSKTTNIFFETDFEADLRAVFNSLCLPKFRDRKINEYFDTIIREATNGLLAVGELPFISLHFNDNHLLYSVMPSYYKNTLIGNILCFMNYFLKGFVNGGFFTVEFVQNWVKLPPNERLRDVKSLNQNLVDIRRSLKKVVKRSGYKTLYDLIDTNKTSEFTSAFRIIGEMKSIESSDGIFFPNAGFSVEHDINPSPHMQMLIESNSPEAKTFEEVSIVYFKMKDIIKDLMPKVPEFRGFFTALDMVTFALHYVSSLHSIGKTVDSKNAFQVKNMESNYTKVIPELFPPLPVSERIKVDPSIKTTELIKCLQGSCLDDEIKSIVIDQKEDFSTHALNEIWSRIEKLYRSRVTSSLKEDSKNYDDEDIHLHEFLSKSIFLIKSIPITIKKLMAKLLSNIEENYHSLLPESNKEKKKKNKLTSSQLYEKLTFNQIESKCKKALKSLSDYLNSMHQEAYQKISNQEKEWRDEEKVLLDIPINQRKQPEHGNYLAKVRHNIDQIVKAKNGINNQNNKNMKIIADFRKSFNTYSTASHSFCKVYKDIISSDHILPQKFYLPRPKIVVNQDGGTINGGCLINFHKQPYIQKVTKSEKQISEIRSCLKSKDEEFVKCSNGHKGFALKLKIVPLFNDGLMLATSLMKDFSRKEKSMNNINGAHIAASIGDFKYLESLSEKQLKEETSDHKTPAYMACDSGNVFAIKALIKKNADFGKRLPNGLYPFLVAIMKGHHDATIYLLLNKNAKIGDVNRTTETGVTPLHWAIYYNFPDIVKLLLERGASITSTLKSNGMTPIHLACYHNRYECLALLATSKDAKYGKSEAGITPLQYAISHSTSCANFLIKQEKSNLNVKDPRGYSMRDIAIMNGNYEIAFKLPKNGKMDHIIKSTDYLTKKESSEFRTLCRALSSGSLNVAEKLVENMMKMKKKLTFSKEQKNMLIENACLGRKLEFVELLSKFINLELYPIALNAAKEGLVDWIQEIQKYSGDLMVEVDGKTIFDEAVDNSDSKFLIKAFDTIEKVPEEVIKRVVEKSIIINDKETISAISDSLMPDKKNYHLLNPEDIVLSQTSLFAFYIYQRNLDSKIEFRLNNFVDFISINLLSYLLSSYSFDKEDLKSSCLKAIKRKRSDNAFYIIQKNPSIAEEIINENSSSLIKRLTEKNLEKAIIEIVKLLANPMINEGDKVNQCKTIFKNVFDVGEIPLYGKETLITLTGKSVQNLWLLKALPLRCIDDFYLSEEAFKEGEIDPLFRKELEIFESLYDLEEAGSMLIKSLKKLNFVNLNHKGLGDEFVSALIDVMEVQHIDAVDDDHNTIFHIASRFRSLKDETMKKMTKSIKNAESPKMKSIINARNRNGENVVLIFASSGNFSVLKFLVKLGIDVKNRDIYGENVLHKILNAEQMTNDKVIPVISRIVHNNPELILQQNRKNENAFVVAAKKGFNGVIGLMSTFYPTSLLDCSTDVSVLHFAAESNYPDTIRYIVQHLHIDVNIKSKDGLTPLHYAAKSSSILAYKELLDLGANPLIQRDIIKLNSIDYALRFGSEEMINYIMNTSSFNLAICSPEILVNVALNPEAYSAFANITSLIDPSALLTCNTLGNNLVSVACINNNGKVVDDLLLRGCDPEKLSFDGQNSIHVCADNSSIGCSVLILKHICNTKGMDGVKEILKVRDSNGDLPYHIAARNGSEGFIVHLLTSNYDYDPTVVNNAGYTALEESLKSGNRKIASILALHWFDLLSESQNSLKNKLNKDLVSQWDELLSSEEFASSNKILDAIKNNAWSFSKLKIPKNMKLKEAKLPKTEFTKELNNLGVKTPKKLIYSCSRIMNNINFQIKILLIAKENVKTANKIINILMDMKSSSIREIAFLMILPRLYDDKKINKFIQLIDDLDTLRIPESHPLFAWIENGIVSVAETSLNSDSLIQGTQNVVDLISYISEDEELMNTIEYPVLPAPVHVIALNILRIDKKFKAIQLKFANLIKDSMLWRKKPHLSVDFGNRVGYNQYSLLNYALKTKLDIDVIERVIQVTLDLYEDPTLTDKIRELVLNQCQSIISSNDSNKTDVKRSDISAWSLNSMKIIQEFGFDYYSKVIKIIPQTSLKIANIAISAILTIGDAEIANEKLINKGLKKLQQKAKEIDDNRFVESRDLDSILQAFSEGSDEFIPYKFAFDGTPVVKLSKSELESLGKLGRLIEKQTLFISISDVALELGKNFSTNPTISNAAKLVSLVRQVIRETFGLNPFIVQCLTVGSILLHRVNKKERKELKGRIAQVATGEGKSIIIAMLSSCIALTGDCVDVISSSSYLAERDAIKFKPFYEKLGLRCGTINDDRGNYDEGFDFHVIYSTNTGFEFALLREGVNGKTMIETTLLFENTKRRRPRMTAIVDEADNLFIDTAMNSARIAQGGSSKLTWIFKPIFDEVVNENEEVDSIREKLLENATVDQAESLESVTNEKLKKLIGYAKHSLTLTNGIDYVVGRNKETEKLEVQIVDANNTGRIMHGSRWSNGLHEFVEVKEGLQVQEQSFTVASISHPSFFELYNEVFGLTGTLGEESEREEIKNIYHVDTFDVPPNRKCLRTREKTIIVSSKEKKDELIIDTIRRITKQKRPILVIVQSIEDSQKLSDILRMQKIKHLVLNDQQPQDEDFIVQRAGRPSAVTIATNTAGRGTDIKVDDSCLSKGGLHTLITFWPSNLRVECQALGRSGRQGQPGSCQIIFESQIYGDDEKLGTSDETLKNVYEKRTSKIKKLSDDRIKRYQNEKEIFAILLGYFDYIRKIMTFLDSAEAETIIKKSYVGTNSRAIKNDLQQKWAEFFSDVCSDDIENPSFELFLEIWAFEKNYPLLFKSFNKLKK